MELVVCKRKEYKLEEYIKEDVKTFLLAVDDFSSSYNDVYTIEEIKNIRRNNPSLSFFLVMNKLMVEEDLEDLKTALEEIELLNISGIFFYDMALLEMKNKLNLKTPLIWNQTHMVTNYKTGDYFNKQGVEGLYLSNEITTEEKITIKQQTKALCFTLLFGFPIVATSKRTLITNAGSFMKKSLCNPLNLTEPVSNQEYLVKEDKAGTSFYYHELLNTTKELSKLKDAGIDYGLLIEEGVSHLEFLKIVKGFKDGLITEDTALWQLKMNTLIHSRYEGFANTSTIYKVKNDEN